MGNVVRMDKERRANQVMTWIHEGKREEEKGKTTESLAGDHQRRPEVLGAIMGRG